MELNKKACALAGGILWGVVVLLTTLWVSARGGGEHLALLGQVYVGYSVSVLGAIIGLVYGFIDGFIGGWLFAWIYDRFLPSRA